MYMYKYMYMYMYMYIQGYTMYILYERYEQLQVDGRNRRKCPDKQDVLISRVP